MNGFEFFKEIAKNAKVLGEEWDKILEAALIMHGHLCGAMPLGFRTGRLALRVLDVEREPNMDMIAFVETGIYHAAACFADGVQFSTGCTYGKDLIKKLDYGKWAVTIVIKKDGRAVRVSVKPEIIQAVFKGKFLAERKKGVPPTEVPQEYILQPFINTITRPDEELLDVSEIFTYEFKPTPKPSFEVLTCEICGEMVAENKMRVKEGKKVCLPCSGYEV